MNARRLCVGASWIGAAMLATQALAGTAPTENRLLNALLEADETRALQLIDKQADLNIRDENGATPLMWAAKLGNAELTTHLLKAGADPNLCDDEGLGPLQIAIGVRATNVALQLIARGADPNAALESGETVLMTAARTGEFTVMKQLIARGADVNAHENQFHQTALMWSAGHSDAVKLLIKHGADIRARTKVWRVTHTIYTQLMHIGLPQLHEGEYEIEKGGQSALFFAVQQDDLQSVKELLAAGADVNDRAADGSTALLLAVYKWDPGEQPYSTVCDLNYYPVSFAPNTKLANMLLDRGAEVAISDATGYTPLHGVVLGFVRHAHMDQCRSNPEILQVQDVRDQEIKVDPQEGLALVKRMLDLKASPNAATRYPTAGPIGHVRINHAAVGSTPLHIAAETGNADLMRLLLGHGGDPNLIRVDGHSPLSIATQADEVPLVELLVAHGGDVKRAYTPGDLIIDAPNENSGAQNELTRHTQNLLHLAAVAGAHKVVPFLVAHGVSLTARNEEGETPLALAEHVERVKYSFNRGQTVALKNSQAPNIRDREDIVFETHASDAIKRQLNAKGIAVKRHAEKHSTVDVSGTK